MPAEIIKSDARELPLPDDSVDLIVTSPPYFGLRSYQDGGEHYAGQIGAEATPREFVDSLIECTREMMRVLKPSGSLWVNLGDKYSGSQHQTSSRTTGIPTKSLMGIPWRYAIRCIDDLGLLLRAEVIWSKPNGLPESVTDRVRRSHETWFHFTLQPQYFAAVDEIRDRPAGQSSGDTATLGKLPGSVWDIATQPLRVPAELGIDHFAAFPMEWPRRLILGWSPREVCTACGEGRRPVTVASHETSAQRRNRLGASDTAAVVPGREGRSTPSQSITHKGGHNAPPQEYQITGYACACPDTSAPATPGVVLDPFSGTGTTALVASMHGRMGIGVDASADYCRLAEWRVSDPKQRERAARPASSR